ncbi:hypothetical protein O1Q96_23565 [Streptomyces sp. Qhu-G9]|uniref:hypothetical protein n=1 Tax=Streptomyces sp. Qhu-G9 TaxID=3452799 RepID=UPI0022AC184C|nr:hypothetical protein [Streptomyces aurantiacus]WAU86676.1 hypothetical protein O1Q96_23565 [Streptomyces aurantiacus]
MRRTPFPLALAVVAATTLSFTTATAAPAAPTITIRSASLTTGGTSVTCPNSLARVVGGGFDVASSNEASVSYPSAARSWTVDAPTEFEPSGTAYAICALGDLTVTIRSAPASPGVATTVTCPNVLARALSGGFRADDSQSAADVTQSYPSGSRSWAVKADAPGTAYAVCGLTSLTTTVRSAPLVDGQATVTCPNPLANVLGGGFTTNGAVPASYPSGPRSWTVKAEAASTTGSVYAVCAVEA